MSSGVVQPEVMLKVVQKDGTIEVSVDDSREMSQLRPIIHSKKHIFQISQATVAQAAVVNTVILAAQEAVSTTPEAVEVGATVKACYLEFWVSQDSASVVGSYTIALYKDPGGNAATTAGNMAALHDYDNKKNILFTAQGLLTPNDGGQVPVLRGWYKIPKGKQRFGLADRIILAIRNNNATAIDINFCGLAIFKEYS